MGQKRGGSEARFWCKAEQDDETDRFFNWWTSAALAAWPHI